MIKPKNKEFQHFFNTHDIFMSPLSHIIGKYSFDILKFDDFMINNHGYNIEKDGSLRDFVEKTFGTDAVLFILSL